MTDNQAKSRAPGTRVAMFVWNDFRHDARVRKEAETLARAGYQVVVFALKLDAATPAIEDPEPGLSVKRLAVGSRKTGPSDDTRRAPSKPLMAWKLLRRLWDMGRFVWAIVKARADIVHSHDVNTLVPAYIAARIRRARLVYDAHEICTGQEGYQQLRGLLYRIERYIIPRADLVITTTSLRARFLARVYGGPTPLVLQNRPRYRPIENTNRLRKELDLVEDWPIFLYQGGLQNGRGLNRLIEAIAHTERTYLVLIGGGRQARALKANAAASKRPDAFHFISTVPLTELASYTVSADVGAQPIRNTCFNHWSTDSNKLFEYLHAGLAVIATGFPEITTIVEKCGCGILVGPAGSDDLANAIASLRDDVELRERFASAARDCAKHMSWNQQEESLLNAYDHLQKGAGRSEYST